MSFSEKNEKFLLKIYKLPQFCGSYIKREKNGKRKNEL